MKLTRLPTSSLVLLSAFFAVIIIPQTSADEFMNIDFDFNLSFDEEMLGDDLFFPDEGFYPSSISSPMNYTTLDNESDSLEWIEVSSQTPSKVELVSNLEAHNFANISSEFFISPITGEKFEIIKDPIDESAIYGDQKGTIYANKEEILNYEIQRLSIDPNILKLDEKLRKIVESDNKNDTIPVVIAFVEQPAHNVSIEVQAAYEPKFEEITAPARAVYERIEPMMIAAGEDSDVIATEEELLTEEEIDLLNETRARLDQETMQMRREIFERSAPLADEIQAPVIRNIEAQDGEIRYSGKIYNSIAASVPIGYLEELSQDPSIAAIWYDELFNASLDVSASAIYANSWWSAGYSGGTWDAAVVDTGVDGSHPDLSVELARTFHTSGSTDPAYNDDPDTTDDLQGHGTHCAGIVASTNSTYKGIGYGVDVLINAKAGWLTNSGGGSMRLSDRLEAVDWALDNPTDDADVISFSFGAIPGSNGDTASCHHMDAVVFSLNTPIAVSAGNSGPAGTTVTDPGSAYNVITVGNVNDKNTVTRSDDVILSSSSRGPTGDGRLKPDVAAPGTLIMSSNYHWETGADFVEKTGTSMAAPHVAGSILLILDYAASQWDSKAVKALLANTAGDLGTSGPDNTYGYGYVDLDHAYFHRGDVHTGSLAATPEGAVEKFYKGPAVSGDTATLVWNRHVVYNGASFPTQFLSLSDLDLYLYDESNGLGISSSTSSLNNAAQVRSDSSYSSAIIKIEPVGSYPSGITSESYALAAEETFSQVNPPTLIASLSVPGAIPSGGTFTASTTVTNTGDIKAHGVSASLNLPTGFSIASGSNPSSLGIVDPGSGNSETATWTIQAPMVSSNQSYTISTSVSSSSYGESYTAANSKQIIVGPPAISPDGVGVFDPTYGIWFLDYDKNGIADKAFYYGATTHKPISGDWDGDGKDTVGVFDPATSLWFLDNNNDGIADQFIYYGASFHIPVTGDWDGDGTDTVGVFDPTYGIWFLDHDNDGITDTAFYYGAPTHKPVVGDWDGDGTDTVGVFDPSTSLWFLDNNNDGVADQFVYYGASTHIPISGDWDGDGTDTVGVFDPSTSLWFLDNDNDGVADEYVYYGASFHVPVRGNWYNV